MKPVQVLALVLAAGIGSAGGYFYAKLPSSESPLSTSTIAAAAAPERTALYYRDPSGAPNWSASPKHDEHGRDFLPVYDDEEVSFDLEPKKPQASVSGSRK